jgi:hypothetical protein
MVFLALGCCRAVNRSWVEAGSGDWRGRGEFMGYRRYSMLRKMRALKRAKLLGSFEAAGKPAATRISDAQGGGCHGNIVVRV